MPARLGITKDDSKCKPALLNFFNVSKGGTDIYRRMGKFSINTKSKQWTIKAVNSQAIAAMSKTIDQKKTGVIYICPRISKKTLRTAYCNQTKHF